MELDKGLCKNEFEKLDAAFPDKIHLFPSMHSIRVTIKSTSIPGRIASFFVNMVFVRCDGFDEDMVPDGVS